MKEQVVTQETKIFNVRLLLMQEIRMITYHKVYLHIMYLSAITEDGFEIAPVVNQDSNFSWSIGLLLSFLKDNI
jgi:hypothetical protein